MTNKLYLLWLPYPIKANLQKVWFSELKYQARLCKKIQLHHTFWYLYTVVIQNSLWDQLPTTHEQWLETSKSRWKANSLSSCSNKGETDVHSAPLSVRWLSQRHCCHRLLKQASRLLQHAIRPQQAWSLLYTRLTVVSKPGVMKL